MFAHLFGIHDLWSMDRAKFVRYCAYAKQQQPGGE